MFVTYTFVICSIKLLTYLLTYLHTAKNEDHSVKKTGHISKRNKYFCDSTKNAIANADLSEFQSGFCILQLL